MSRSLKVDISSGFAASMMKMAAYFLISRILYAHGTHIADFAMFTLIRSTLGLLNYATLGLGPALIRRLAGVGVPPLAPASARVDYDSKASLPPARLYASAQYPALAIGCGALLVLIAYSFCFTTFHLVPPSLLHYAPMSAMLVGLAMLARLLSDIPGGYLQANHRIALDNMLLLLGDFFWPILTWLLLAYTPTPLVAVSLGLFICYALLAISRFVAAWVCGAAIFAPWSLVDRSTAVAFLAFGVMLTLSQLSDFLYAPTDFILINRFLTDEHQADYSVVVQMDAALLLLSVAVSTVLYPRAARALAARDIATLRRYYTRGTLLTIVVLGLAAAGLVLIRKPLVTMWLGTDRPATAFILPLIMVHTIVGGSTATGRAILLAANKAKVFALSALIAGLLNVVISYVLVRYTSLALTGVILGTIIAVILRCGIFLPWYTCHILKRLLPPDSQSPPAGLPSGEGLPC